jgi:hypothetical protein
MRMGMLRALVGRPNGLRLTQAAVADTGHARLAVKTSCVLVADLVEIDSDGTSKVVLSGVNDQVARDLYRELTGRPWTRAEAS